MPSIGALAAGINRLVHQVSRLKSSIQALKGSDVDYLPNMLLFHLAVSGPMRASALAEHTDIDPSTISRQVDRLVRTGLVERRADPDDGRATLLVATATGLDRHAGHIVRRNAVFDGMLAHWSEQDRTHFAELLSRFSDDFDNYKHVLIADITTGSPADDDDAQKEHA